MKRGLLLLPSFVFALLFCNHILAQTLNKDYDSSLAKKLGADERGMRMYVLAILKSGTAKDLTQQARDSIFAGHMKNINRLANEGKLVTAGPLEKNDNNYRGIYIFNATTIEEGRQLVATDPAIQSKALDFDLYVLYGSAAYMELPSLHKKLHKNEF